jgi:hypothetical protein
MNLLFAIGAKCSHLIGAQCRGDERDHLVYMARAVNLLGLKNSHDHLSARSRTHPGCTYLTSFDNRRIT